jgi:L-lactate dehydrogenase (cytochrome)
MTDLNRIATISDLRDVARRKLPRPVFDFIDGSAFQEITLGANVEDFERIRFRLRGLRNVAERNLATTILDQPASMPAAIAPIGLGGVTWGGGGELQAARAAKAADIPFILGMLSVATLEEVVADVGPVWFQFCMLKDRGLVKSLVERAIEAQSPVLVMTITWAASGLQSRMVRNAMSLPPRLTPRNVWHFATKPTWVARTLTGKRAGFNNFAGIKSNGGDHRDYIIGQLDSSTTWKDLDWLRSIWPGKLIIKGVCGPDEAHLAMDSGVDAVSVSNHGGNQLDGAASTISVLPSVVEAVGGRGEVLLDGGVRSGQDVLKALAYGATACLLGRAHLYGLGAYGEKGVTKALDIIRYGLDVSTALTGLSDVRDASTDILVE